MSVERLIDLIAERQLLAPKLVAKLRAKVAEVDQRMTADALANFLVRKQHLTQAQAQELLDAGMTFEPLPLTAIEEEDGSSSIFGPSYIPKSPCEDVEVAGDEEVFTLIPIEDDTGQFDPEVPIVPGQKIPEPQLAPEDAFAGEPRTEESPSATERHSSAIALPPVASADTSSVRAAPSLKKKKKRKNQWDSPLLLIGGGILMLMIICGVTVALIISRRGGDEKLAEARKYRDAGSFAQAITAYEEFVVGYPRDESWNKARMELSLAKIRQAVEAGGDFVPALKIAQTELEAFENDKQFDQLPDARPELAELLPQIARGLAQQAGQTEDPAESQRLAEQAVAALELCRNAKFISKDLRDDVALAEVESELARVNRRQQTRGELADTIKKMKSAVSGGDIRAAYAAHEELLATHPELAGDASLRAAILETSTAERGGIKFVVAEQAAETSERPTPWQAVLSTTNREEVAPAPATGVFTARIDGAIYAFDVTDGRLLWRRYAGYAAGLPPLSANGQVLVYDSKFQELLNLDERSGQLRWRQTIGEPTAPPLLVGGKAFLAARSGKLYVLDFASGNRLGYLQFAQPLQAAPIVDQSGKHLYLTGDHSSLYTISLADLKSTGVFHLGHSSGSIAVPPAQVLNRLAVLENDGVATCRLRVLALDVDGQVQGQITERRLQGLAASSPLVDSRRLIVITDRGELGAFDVSSADDASVLTSVATREPTSRHPLTRHALMTQGAIWVGDTQLTKFAVQPTGDRLPVQSLEHSFIRSTFDHPLALFGSVLVHVRRIDDRAGVTVTAIDEASGRIYWNNELAVPPAASPIVDETNRAVAMADVNGRLYRFDETALRARVQDAPLAPLVRGDSLKLDSGVDAGGGRGAFAAPRSGRQLVIYDPANERTLVQSLTLPSTVACPMTRFGKQVLVPLEIGQVLSVDPSAPHASPIAFQPRLEPGKKVAYQPAGAVDDDGRQFVITDGFDRIYLVELKDDPSPHFEIVTEQKVGAFPIVSPVVVLADTAFAAIDGGQLVRFALPTLENQGNTDLSGDVVWGPYRVGDAVLLATTRDSLVAIRGDGSIAWSTELSAGDIAGPPQAGADSVFIAYKQGMLERRSLADGQVAGSVNVEQPLAAGPVVFLDRIVLTTHDGSLLVIQQP